MEIKYSIIIPNRNNKKLLQRLLDSIPLRADIEIIIIDDASDEPEMDESNYPGKGRLNTTILFSKECKGAGFARNRGILKAVGKWLLFADSDDFYNNRAFDVLDQYSEGDYDIFFFDVNSVDSDTLLKSHRDKNYGRYIDFFLSNREPNGDSIRFRKWEPWFKMFKRTFICENRIIYDEIPRCNDMSFNLRAAYLAKKIGATREKLYCVTSNSTSVTRTKIRKDVFWYCILCEIKKNYLYKITGHRNWQTFYIYIIICLIKNNGFCETFDFLRMLYSRRREIVEYHKHLITFFR